MVTKYAIDHDSTAWWSAEFIDFFTSFFEFVRAKVVAVVAII